MPLWGFKFPDIKTAIKASRPQHARFQKNEIFLTVPILLLHPVLYVQGGNIHLYNRRNKSLNRIFSVTRSILEKVLILLNMLEERDRKKEIPVFVVLSEIKN